VAKLVVHDNLSTDSSVQHGLIENQMYAKRSLGALENGLPDEPQLYTVGQQGVRVRRMDRLEYGTGVLASLKQPVYDLRFERGERGRLGLEPYTGSQSWG
jgi:hypothetical protein